MGVVNDQPGDHARDRRGRRAGRGAGRPGVGRLGLPSLLLYLGIGVLLGEAVLGIQFDDADLTQSLGMAALVLILTEGGLTTRWSAVRPALGVGIALSTVSVGVSIAVTGFALHFLLDMDWRTACCGARCSRPPTPPPCSACCAGSAWATELIGALELESGINDAPVYSPSCCSPPPTRSRGPRRC